MTEQTVPNGRKKDQARSERLVHQLVGQINRQPEQFEPYYELATVLVDLNSYAQAEELLMKALGLFGDDANAVERLHYGLGNVYYAAQDYPKAIAQFDQLTAQLKAAGYLMIAQSYMGQGDHKRALAFALTALTSQPQDGATLQVIGENLLALGDMAQAAQYYDQVLAQDPHNGRAAFDRGLIAMVQGTPYADFFATAQRLAPDYYAKGQKRLQEIERFVNAKRQSPDAKE